MFLSIDWPNAKKITMYPSLMLRSKKYQTFCLFHGGGNGVLINYVLRRLSLFPLMRPWKQFLLSLGSVDFWWDKRSLMNYSERELPRLVSLSRGNTITSRNTTSQLYQLWSCVHIPANNTIIISVVPSFPSLTKFQNCREKLVLVGFNVDDG